MGREIFVYARVDAHAHHELGGKYGKILAKLGMSTISKERLIKV